MRCRSGKAAVVNCALTVKSNETLTLSEDDQIHDNLTHRAAAIPPVRFITFVTGTTFGGINASVTRRDLA